jgi:hypothetical protein
MRAVAMAVKTISIFLCRVETFLLKYNFEELLVKKVAGVIQLARRAFKFRSSGLDGE